ncbi:MAG: 30S ribosomal protein S20 [Dehalococcoidia bacterium]|nr:30S ribosomal protein S20 [Dehalococcoidia bacterium]
MAHSSSAKKRVRSSLKKNRRNRPVRTQSRSCVVKADKLISDGNLDAAEAAVKEAISILDKTARKKVIHPNCAARRKSRLVRQLKAAQAQASAKNK